MDGSGTSETIEATISPRKPGDPRTVSVVYVGRRVDRGAVMPLAVWVIVTLVVLLGMMLLFNVWLATFPDPSTERHQVSLAADYLQLASFIIPTLVALFGFYRLRLDMRDAIAGAFLVSFIVVLSQSLLLNIGSTEPPPGSLRATLMTNYMTLLGTIALFYFGSEAVIRSASHYSTSRIGSAVAGANDDLTTTERSARGPTVAGTAPAGVDDVPRASTGEGSNSNTDF